MEPYEISKITLAIAETMRGNPDAYTVIVTAYMQKLYRKALTMTKNSAAAEDLVQETFIDGYLHLYDLREPEKIEGWLMRILKNKTLNHLTRARKTEPEEVLYSLSDRRSPESLYESVETLDEWKKKLHSLPGAQREVALLYFLTELTMEEIAERTRLPLGTVKRRIHDARATLRKETEMTEKEKLPDSFAIELSKKIKDLESYTNIYGNVGFDDAYRNVKTLISNLSDAENVEKYSIESAKIAVNADMRKYADEALAVYRKFGDVHAASWLMLDLCFAVGEGENHKAQLDYTLERIIPELLLYPETEERSIALGEHYLWIACYLIRTSKYNIDEAKKYLSLSKTEFSKTQLVYASHANLMSAIKALDCLTDGRKLQYISTTGEKYAIKDNNLVFLAQPGCSYAYNRTLASYHNYIFYYAGYVGDKYFFPRTIPLKAGEEEKMILENGKDVGIRRVVSTDETVVTPAGTFEKCLHIQKIDEDGDPHDTWYCDGIGIVKSASAIPTNTKVLSSYNIAGGEGWLPLAVGNSWNYETPNRPDSLYERHEYTVEQRGNSNNVNDLKAVSISCLNYIALENDWEDTAVDPSIIFTAVNDMCNEHRFEDAAEALRAIIIKNRTRDSVDIASSVIGYLEEKISYDRIGWRFCPSSANISAITKKDGKTVYEECGIDSFDMGQWGSRSEENRIFGVKPFRYLQELCGTLWSDKWVPSYTEDIEDEDDGEGIIHLKVTDGGTIVTPAGTFDNTVRLSIDFEVEGNRDDYFHYFYSHTYSGLKEFWFAPGVGIVRHTCKWGKHMDSEAVLTEYRAVAKDGEMFPVHIGNYWKYNEVNLTRENYIARFDCKIISGTNGKYNAALAQMFTYKGTVEEYEDFKRKIAKKV